MSKKEIVKTRRNYQLSGLCVGVCIGIIAGVVIGGPQYPEWENPLINWVTLIISCATAGGFIGFIFFCLLVPTPNKDSYNDNGYGGSGGDYGGNDTGGDGGGGD